MLTQEDHNRVIDLSDAANRALSAGNGSLAQKLTAEADKLLTAGAGQTFEQWMQPRNYNLEQYGGAYASKITQELYDCWLAAGGSK
jgi:hypothetical protein